MSVLTACQEAAVELNQPEPSALFSSTSQFVKELRLQANRAAVAIAQCYDWQRLLTLATLSGDASAITFAMPSDYDRMPKKAEIHSASFQGSTFRKATDLDEWIYLTDTDLNATPGHWIIIGGEMNISPAMAVGETARFYYITKNIDSGSQTAFTADTDTFLLPERLLSLGIVWRWRASKRMDYAEDLANFNIALQEEIGKDRGSNILVVGRRRSSLSAAMAYPRALGS